jgi:hypothetical protein
MSYFNRLCTGPNNTCVPYSFNTFCILKHYNDVNEPQNSWRNIHFIELAKILPYGAWTRFEQFMLGDILVQYIQPNTLLYDLTIRDAQIVQRNFYRFLIYVNHISHLYDFLYQKFGISQHVAEKLEYKSIDRLMSDIFSTLNECLVKYYTTITMKKFLGLFQNLITIVPTLPLFAPEFPMLRDNRYFILPPTTLPNNPQWFMFQVRQQ